MPNGTPKGEHSSASRGRVRLGSTVRWAEAGAGHPAESARRWRAEREETVVGDEVKYYPFRIGGVEQTWPNVQPVILARPEFLVEFDVTAVIETA